MDYNWDDLRYFLAIHREGSATGAARRLGVAVTTVTRRLDSLEESLDTIFIRRTQQGTVLTPEGEVLLDEAIRVEEAMVGLERRLKERQKLSGPVRISTLETVATELLSPFIAPFSEQYPEIELTVIGENHTADLLRGEADLAIRLRRPKQLDLVSRRLAVVHFGLFGAPAYLERNPWEAGAENPFEGHRLVCMAREFDNLWLNRWLEKYARDAHIVFRSHHTQTIASAIRGGAGIGLLPQALSEGLTPLAHPEPIAATPLWLVYHEDLRHIPRIRKVIDFLIELLSA